MTLLARVSLAVCLQVLQLLIRLYEDCPQPDYTVICQCLMFLDDAPGVAKILNKLISSSGVSNATCSAVHCFCYRCTACRGWCRDSVMWQNIWILAGKDPQQTHQQQRGEHRGGGVPGGGGGVLVGVG